MDLIQSYHDQGSQSSSDEDETKYFDKNAAPSTSYSGESAPPKAVSSFEPLERIPMDRLMIATAAIAAKKPTNQKQKQKQTTNDYTIWLSDTDREIRMCLGSIQSLQKHTILESMDRLASKLTKDYDKISKPRIADFILQHIRIYLNIYKYLFRSFEKGKRYYKRFIRILAVYTDLELCASIRGAEYDKAIAERMVLTYQTYLDHLDGSMVMDVLLSTKRLWRQHRGILVYLFQYFLARKMAVELPDTLFMKTLIIFKKWLYIEEFPEDRKRVREIFIRYVKPKKTICMNSVFKPYLPVDAEGFVTIDNPNDILDKEYSIAPLIRCLKKAEQRSEPQPTGSQQNAEVIVLTDDEQEDEDDSFSNHGESSATYSHHDEMSNDFDWYSASSQQEIQSDHTQNFIETVSLDSPQPVTKKTASMSSLDSCDLNMDTTNSLVSERIDENAQHPDVPVEMDKIRNEMPSTSGTSVRSAETNDNEANGENVRNLSTLDESVFNRLVNDINATHVSIPSNGNNSADSKIIENGGPGETMENIEIISSLGLCRTDSLTSQIEKLDKAPPADNEQFNGIAAHPSDVVPNSVACSSNGESSMTSRSSDHNVRVASKLPTSVLNNHNDVKMPEEIQTVNNCDNNVNIISSCSPLKNHEETLRNINEIVEDDLKNHDTPANEPSTSTSKDVQLNTAPDIAPQDWIPAAESTSTIITETSLLSKSEQEVLFKDKDASLMFTDLWSNGQTSGGDPKPEDNKTIRSSSESPIAFQPNGMMKTYSRRFRRGFVETKTISTQTSGVSGCPSPVTTIDESANAKKDRYLLNEKEDDELFLRDIFNTTDLPARSGGSPRIRSPLFASPTPSSAPVSSTPVVSAPTAATQSASTPLESSPFASFPVAFTPDSSTPMASTSHNMTDSNVQSSINSSAVGSTEVVVKRKRGRPRKYPLPEPGTMTTPTVPKPPRAPRPYKPRTPIEPFVPVVLERRLRERKPKPVVIPEPKIPKARAKPKPKPRPRSEPKPKARGRRRNTIKMTIDAIFKKETQQFRAIQARRISNLLGIPIDSPKLAKILKRIDYNKSMNMSQSMNSDSSANQSSSMLQTFKNRSNGQMNSTETTAARQDTPSTILARKTYIKPNLTFSSFTSALRRISFSARRLSFSSSIRQNRMSRMSSARKAQSQRYTKIDIFDTSKGKRGRKKGSKDTKPRKRRGQNTSRKTKSTADISLNLSLNTSKTADVKKPIIEVSDKVNDTSIELVDLTKELAPFELDASMDMNVQFDNIQPALSSTIFNDSEPLFSKRRNFLSDDEMDTDLTNEFTTDPESSAVEDADDSHTRKSKRRRKRPKILDL